MGVLFSVLRVVRSGLGLAGHFRAARWLGLLVALVMLAMTLGVGPARAADKYQWTYVAAWDYGVWTAPAYVIDTPAPDAEGYRCINVPDPGGETYHGMTYAPVSDAAAYGSRAAMFEAAQSTGTDPGTGMTCFVVGEGVSQLVVMPYGSWAESEGASMTWDPFPNGTRYTFNGSDEPDPDPTPTPTPTTAPADPVCQDPAKPCTVTLETEQMAVLGLVGALLVMCAGASAVVALGRA